MTLIFETPAHFIYICIGLLMVSMNNENDLLPSCCFWKCLIVKRIGSVEDALVRTCFKPCLQHTLFGLIHALGQGSKVESWVNGPCQFQFSIKERFLTGTYSQLCLGCVSVCMHTCVCIVPWLNLGNTVMLLGNIVGYRSRFKVCACGGRSACVCTYIHAVDVCMRAWMWYVCMYQWVYQWVYQ